MLPEHAFFGFADYFFRYAIIQMNRKLHYNGLHKNIM